MITSQSNTAMHKNLQTTGSNKLPWLLNFWILAVIMIASWGATWLILWLSFRDCNVIGDSANDLKTSWVEAGTFGDMFGCLTCLFTGLSVAALIITLRQQKKAIELQQQELDVFKNEVRTQSIMEHITGIRGIAILLIVLFHYTMGNAQLPDFVRFENGYLGVEIFMCIMGYFSMRGFLAKRNVNILQYISSKATRLLTPPTAILICLVSCASVFLLDFSHIKLLSGTGTFTLLGLSNFELIRSARDYFATDSSMNAFLHLWYISVAMQLFILALVLYVLLKGRSRKAAILILFFIGIISYCFDSCIEKKHLAELGLHPYIGDCLTSYYSSVTRIWQFLAGGLVIFLPNVNSGPVQKNIYSASLLLIFFSVCVPFSFIPQSILSLVVIASTILLIKYAKGCQILENRFILFLGKISFSLYLVHMPLIVFYKGYTMQSPSEGVLAILVAVAILAAYAFYNYVEKAQFKKHHAILLYGLALTISLTLLYTNGLKNQWHSETNNITFNKYDHFRYRYDNSLLKEYNASTMVTYGSTGAAIVNTLSSEKCSISKAHPSPFLQIGKDSLMPSFVLIGDSHAIMSYPGLDEICAKKGVSGILMNSLFLPFVDREYGNPLDSYAINENKTKDFLKWLKNQENIEHIVIIFSWYWATNDLCVSSQGKKIQDLVFENMESMKSYLHELNSINKKAIVFMPYPRFATNNMPMYVRHRHRRGLTEAPILGEYIVTKEEYRSMWGECITKLKELEKIGLCSIIDPTTELFKNGSCYSINNNKLNFFDCNHMSADVSLDVARSIEHQFFNLLERE